MIRIEVSNGFFGLILSEKGKVYSNADYIFLGAEKSIISP